MFNYMLSFEIADSVIALIVGFVGIFRCGALCRLGYRYVTKLLELVFYSYVANALQVFQTFLEIAFALERIQAFRASTPTSMRFRNQIIIMMTVALLVSLPNYLIVRSVTPLGVLNETGEVLYQIGVSDFVQN